MGSTRGRAAEQRGDVEEAVRLFVQDGELEEAARILVAHNDHARAGRILFRAIGLPIDRMKEADAAQRKLAIKAGICLMRAGETNNAVSLFIAAGEPQRAVDALQRAGDAAGAAKLQAQITPEREAPRVGPTSAAASTGKFNNARRLEEQGQQAAALTQYIEARAFQDAGRLARVLGKPEQAGELFEEGSYFYEAAVCYHEARDMRRCLAALMRVPKDHTRYRASCVKAIELSSSLGELGFELDQLVSRFVASGPSSPEEVDAFYVLGRLYEKASFVDNARECYAKIVEKQPGHMAAQRLQELTSQARGSNLAYERILREDSAFHADAPRRSPYDPPTNTFAVPPELPDLPELPDPRRAAARAPTQIGPATGTRPAVSPAPRTPQPTMAAPVAAPPPQVGANTMMLSDLELIAAGEANVPEPARPPAPPEGRLDPKEGAVIADRYRLERKIGQGGTAVVFRAHDLELEEDVAIKIFNMTVDDPEQLRRFKQELSVARRLSHPNIVRLHDIGTYRGCRFLTMEMLQGEDLAAILARGNVRIASAVDYLIQACSGLSLAHQHGIVHRDIKPENFFLTSDGVLKVMDFGIAKKASAQKRTQAGFIAGTPPYMSPEQINGFADVSALADIYSLGIVAYELLTGVLPFEHEELMPLLMMHLMDEPAKLTKHNPKVPQLLEALVLRLLAKEPAKRVPNMAELGSMLTTLKPLVANL